MNIFTRNSILFTALITLVLSCQKDNSLEAPEGLSQHKITYLFNHKIYSKDEIKETLNTKQILFVDLEYPNTVHVLNNELEQYDILEKNHPESKEWIERVRATYRILVGWGTANFYEYKNAGGQSIRIRANEMTCNALIDGCANSKDNWDNRISSFFLHPKSKIALSEHENEQGHLIVFYNLSDEFRLIPDLDDYQMTPSKTWNNQISSVGQRL